MDHEQRLGRLERSLRRWRLGTLAAVMLLGAGVIAGAVGQPEEKPGIVTAEVFVAQNSKGEIVAMFGANEVDDGYLTLYDRGGRAILDCGLAGR